MIGYFDADHILYLVTHNKKLEDGTIENKSLEDCLKQVDSYINSILVQARISKYIIILTKGRNFRYDISFEYKANRKDLEKPKYLDEVKQYLIDKYQAIYDSKYEADDICCILRSRLGGVIISPDKDLLNLEGSNYNPRKNEYVLVTREQANEKFWISMIKGDTIDNIKGIPGKGEKYAEKLFGITEVHRPLVLQVYCEFFGEYKGIEEFYKNYKMLKIVDEDDNFKFEESQFLEIQNKNDFKENINREEVTKETK